MQGSLTHQDSMGTSETLGRGAVQFMTAGTGVQHSEHNLDKQNPLRFIQARESARYPVLSFFLCCVELCCCGGIEEADSSLSHSTNTTRFPPQMWFTPRRSGLKPNYGSFTGDLQGRQDR